MAMPCNVAVIAVTAGCIVAAGAIGCGQGDEQAPAVRASSASGAVQLSNSGDGQAILDARRMVPGDSARGTVTISNTGDAAGATRLEPIDLVDTPGPAGARLSQQLELEVTDTDGNPLYRGPLADMPAIDAGTFAPGERRTYRFVATLPRSSGNAYQGAAASVNLRWTAIGGGEAPDEKPPAQPPIASAPSGAPKRLTVTVRRTRIGKNRSRARARVGRTLVRNRIRLAVICSRPCRVAITGTARWGAGRHRVTKVKRV